MHDIVFNDYLSEYKSLIPKEVKPYINIYKDIIVKVAEVQKKLNGNLYRVSDVKDLEKAVESGKIKPAMFSVIEEQHGTYKLVRYNEFFSKEFKYISDLLQKIETDLPNGDYKDFIASLKTAYINNNFIDPFKKWIQLDVNAYPVGFTALPDEAECDFRFNTMLGFDASLRFPSEDFMDIGGAEYKEHLIGAVKNYATMSDLHVKAQGDLDRVKIRVDYTIFNAGVHAEKLFNSQNLPDNRQLAKDWGSRVIIYKTVTDQKVKNGIFDFAKKVIADYPVSEKETAISFTHKSFSHEIVEALMKFEGEMGRLGKWYARTREFNANMTGISTYVLYLLKFGNADNWAKNICYTYTLSALDYYRSIVKDPESITSHYEQYIAVVNYMLKNGGLKINNKNQMVVEPKAALKSINELSKISSKLLMAGKESEAEEFFNKYNDTKPFKQVLGLK
jgi:hypothetical protein